MNKKFRNEIEINDLDQVTGGYGRIVSDEDYERCVNYVKNSNQSATTIEHVLYWLNNGRFTLTGLEKNKEEVYEDRGIVSYDEFVEMVSTSWSTFY